jgi:hypothetical protein
LRRSKACTVLAELNDGATGNKKLQHICRSGVQHTLMTSHLREMVFDKQMITFLWDWCSIETARTYVEAVFHMGWQHLCNSTVQYQVTELPLVIVFKTILHRPKS